jgi:ribosome biogenesis GTPase A
MGQQWIKVGKEMELLDTPGILWPKFEDQNVGYRLAVTGAIKEEILNAEDIAFFGISYLMRYYWDSLEERYGLQEFSKDADDSDSVVAIMEQVGRIRGCVVSGGRIDLEKASRAFLRELRAGKMGRFSMEAPY